MPRMRTVSACADVGSLEDRDSERRSQGRDRDPHQPRLNLPDIGIFIGPIWFRGRTPGAFRGFIIGHQAFPERSIPKLNAQIMRKLITYGSVMAASREPHRSAAQMPREARLWSVGPVTNA